MTGDSNILPLTVLQYEMQNCLTLLSIASHVWDLNKQCRPRSDAAESCIWSVSTLFARRNFYQNYDKNDKSTPDAPKIGNGLIQLITMDGSTRQMWVKGLIDSFWLFPLLSRGNKTSHFNLSKFEGGNCEVVLVNCYLWLTVLTSTLAAVYIPLTSFNK